MAIPATSELLLDLERRRLRALVDADFEVAVLLHADDYQLITPGGDAFSKREYLDGIASGALNYRVLEVASDVVVKAFDDVGAVRYRARIEIKLPNRRDGGLFWHTDIYKRRGRNWQAVWSHATRIPDGQ